MKVDPISVIPPAAVFSASPAAGSAPPRVADEAGEDVPPPSAALARARAQLDRVLKAVGQQVTFAMDPGSERVVVRVIDSATREVVRQIPTEEALALANAIAAGRGSFAAEA